MSTPTTARSMPGWTHRPTCCCVHCDAAKALGGRNSTGRHRTDGGSQPLDLRIDLRLPTHPYPAEALDAVRDALVTSAGMGEEPLHISDVYSHTGQAVVILDALAGAGFDLWALPAQMSDGPSPSDPGSVEGHRRDTAAPALPGPLAEDADDDGACPDDPGGQHYIGCGCEDSDVLS